METEHITGKYARKLLDSPAASARWEIEQRHLAETIAWLYGKEPTQSWPDDNESAYEFGRSDNGDWHRVSVWQNGKAIDITVTDTLNPDQAVEAARALLAAAEKAGGN